MPKFEKKYVHFMWDDSLLGKKVFYSNSIDTLQEYVEKNSKDSYEVVTQQGYSDAPFLIDGTGSNGNCSWIFAYYDPHYELKLAYEQGKIIQIRHKETDQWVSTPIWEWDENIEYRIRPEEEKPITNRELARWLADGKGQWTRSCDGFYNCFTDVTYKRHRDDDDIDYDILVRKWEDDEWVKPTREYMGLD